MYNPEQIFLFFGLSATEIATVEKVIPAPINYKRGECIYNAEQFQKALCIMLEGTAAAKSGEVIKRRFTEGDIFGAATLFTDSTDYISNIVALSECTVQLIPEEVLKEIFSKNPETAINYIRFLTEKVRFLNKKIAQLSAPSVAEKLYSFFTCSADDNGTVTVPSMMSLARQTGIGRTSLYRGLDELEGSGLIERKENIIRVISK